MSSMQKESVSRERYWILALILVAVVMYSNTCCYLWGKWMDETQYSLGFLVPFVCGYFVRAKWSEVVSLKRSPSAWGLALIVLGLLFHIVGTILDISGPSGVSIIIVIIGACLYFHGKSLLRVMAFPLAYMVFMIPIPGGIIDRLSLPMQLFASGSTAKLLGLVIPNVSRAGIQINVDGYEFIVASACSGMSSLVALVGVTAVFAYLTSLSTPLKWLMFSLSLPIALAANIVRITSIGLLGNFWDWDSAMSIYHDFSSPLLFLVAIGMLFMITGGLEWLSARRTTQ